MKKLKYIAIFLTGMFAITNISAMEGHKHHEHDEGSSSDKVAVSEKASDKGHKEHDCQHMKRKKCKKMCPGHMKGVVKTTKNIENGIEITLTAKKTKKVAKLREIAREHYNPEAKESMCKNCPCKVEGANVRIEDIENGVRVLITADDPETVKKIQEAAEKHEHQKGSFENYIPSGEELGKEAFCPVMKNKFKISEKTKALKYNGKIFYFCCPSCVEKFKENPDKFSGETQEETKKSLKYVCPMGCAESDKPGKCPKCGMEMIEKKS